MACHVGFLSGRLISSNEGTWVLFHHDSSAAPQTASPVCGAKNLVSVRLYSAPQLHRTIAAFLGICARNRPFSRAISFSASIRVAALFLDARRIAIGSQRPFLCNAVGKLGRAPFGTFFKHAERARDPISRQHYREMAAHYRSLSVEHQEIEPQHEATH